MEESIQAIGFRIICDQDGEIIYIENELKGNFRERKTLTEIHCIDLEYGAVNLFTHEMVAIDMDTKKPILEELPIVETEEQKRIRELEDAILMQADTEDGGIL